MTDLPHELRILGANLALVGPIAALLILGRAGLRDVTCRLLSSRALIEGRPRLYRALFRSYRQRRRLVAWQQRELEECFGLFWEGAFERALAGVDVPRGRANNEATRSLAVSLKIQCLIASGRPVDARRLFDTEAASLVLVKPPPFAGADENALEAMIQFHEGSFESSREKLVVALARLDARWPMSRLVHFYLGAVEHKLGRLDRARFHLEAAIRGGGDLFVTRWAEHAHSDLFPGSLAIPRWISQPGRRPRALTRGGLLRTLAGALSLLLFEKSSHGPARDITYERTATLALVNVLCVGLLRCVDYRRGASFLTLEALALAAPILSFPITALLATRGLRTPGLALRVTGAFYSALPAFLAMQFLGARAYRNGSPLMVSVVEITLAAWSLALFLFLVRSLTRRASAARLVVAGAVVAATWLAPMHYVEAFPIWYRWAPEPPEDDDRTLAEFTFRQAELLQSAESTLRPERPGTIDLYFLGFGGWGAQDVFLHEIEHAQMLFDRRFDTRDRSILLSNDPSVRTTLPMASKLGLGHVLRAIGARMNRQEDVLFLLLTSHGSERGLAIQAPDAPEFFAGGEISPIELRSLLDEAGIKWRVLMVSSCKSGVFVGPLHDDFTLIATASASDRLSFGCAPGKDFTSYGRAVLEQLGAERSFASAFAKAAEVGQERETPDRLTPRCPSSSPGRLGRRCPASRSLELRLPGRGCRRSRRRWDRVAR